MTTQQPQVAPPGFEGSLPEFLVFAELVRQGLVPGVDFIFQSKRLGGRLDKGGLILDFIFNNPPNLAINVQGVFFHYEQGSGIIANDRMSRAQVAGSGIVLIFIDEDDILRDVEFYVREALLFNDHSRLGRGG